jgi:hypothetical protein
MKLNDKELEEILTINEQAKSLIRGLTYTEELSKVIISCMKDKTELPEEYIQKAHNNYLALCLIGLNQCDTETFKKLDEYIDRIKGWI